MTLDLPLRAAEPRSRALALDGPPLAAGAGGPFPPHKSASQSSRPAARASVCRASTGSSATRTTRAAAIVLPPPCLLRGLLRGPGRRAPGPCHFSGPVPGAESSQDAGAVASSAGRCRTLHGAGAAPGPCQAACRARRANRSATNLTQEHCRDSPRPRQLRNARCLEVGSRHSVAGDRCCCSSPQSPFCAQTEIDGTRRRRGQQLRACCYFFTPRILPVVSRATSLCCPRRPHAAAAHAATAHQGVCASGRLCIRASAHLRARLSWPFPVRLLPSSPPWHHAVALFLPLGKSLLFGP